MKRQDSVKPLTWLIFLFFNDKFEYKVDETGVSKEERSSTPEIPQDKKRLWGLFLCKECYENLFNPNTRYIDVEEFERELPAESWKGEPPQAYFDWKKQYLSVIWDLPPLKV